MPGFAEWRRVRQCRSRGHSCQRDGLMMRAVICNTFDGVDSLVLGTMDSPKPRPHQVLVDVHAASISFMDCLMVAGKYQLRPQTPFVPGTDAAGVVAEVGSEVTRFKP